MIPNTHVLRQRRVQPINITSDNDENKENIFMDVNEQENSSKINLNSDDREFGTDITNIINIDRTEIINVKQRNFRVTTQGQNNFNEIYQGQREKANSVAFSTRDTSNRIFNLIKIKDTLAKNNYVINTRDDCNRVDSNITEFVKKKKKSTNTTNSFSINELDYEHIKNKVKNRSTYHMNNVDWNNNLPRIVEQPTEITVDDNSMHSVSTIISVNNMSNGNIDRVSSMNCNTNNNVNQHKDANPLLRINRSHSTRLWTHENAAIKMDASVSTNSQNVNNPKFLNKREFHNFLFLNQRPNYCLLYSPINEYMEEIYINLKKEEKEYLERNDHNSKHKIDSGNHFMNRQSEISDKMRAILIDWLVQIHVKFRLRTKTLFLSISIMDRYLTKHIIQRTKLQLLGVTSLLIASKQEEIDLPLITYFAYITDNAYTKEQIREMEKIVLNALSFEILKPTQFQFYEIICYILGLSSKEICFGRYLMETFLIDYRSTFYSSSLIACSTVYIVMKYFRFKNYQIIYSDFFNSNNTSTNVKECAKDIYSFIDIIGRLDLCAVKNKFGHRSMHEVSVMNMEE